MAGGGMMRRLLRGVAVVLLAGGFLELAFMLSSVRLVAGMEGGGPSAAARWLSSLSPAQMPSLPLGAAQIALATWILRKLREAA